MPRALDFAINAVWAMEETSLEQLMAIAARENEVTPEALAAYRAKSLANAERTLVRGSVAIMNVEGALFQKANLMTDVSGATSYDMLRLDLQAALDDPKVKTILLNVDSPGGAANGVSELAQAIYEARSQKRVVAYVGGMAASAGYWIASAADQIIVDPTALLGSIGVQMAIREPAAKAGEKNYRFVSSQSPNKNADPGTDAGAKGIQDMIDAMASVFYETVARNRGVDTKTALNDFGMGAILVGKDAVKAGLADAIGSFETVLAELSASAKGAAASGSKTRNGRTTMSETSEQTVMSADQIAAKVAQAVTKAQNDERARLGALHTIAAAHGVPNDTLTAAINSGTPVADFAVAVAQASAKANADAAKAALVALKTDEAKVAVVESSTTTAAPEGNSVEKTANEIIASMDAANGKA